MMSFVFAVLQATQSPVYSAQVQMVGVTVSAVDATSGASVLDLKLEDFEVRDEGKRREILYFEREQVPASVIIMLDTSSSMRERIPAITEAAANLIRTLRPGDEVHVATFDERYQVLCEFTTDHEAAIASLSSVQPGDMTAFNRSLYIATRFLELQHHGDVKHRRILIVLSDGEDTSDLDASFSYTSSEDVLRRSSVICYIVYLQRAFFGNPFTIAGKKLKGLSERARQFVAMITYETGGRLLSVSAPYQQSVIASAFSGIAADIASQYHLGYVLDDVPTKSGWRAVSVSLKSRSGVQIKYRRGYYALAKEK